MYMYCTRVAIALPIVACVRVRCAAVRVAERGRRLDPLHVGDHLLERRVQQPLPLRVHPEDRRIRPAGTTAIAAPPDEPEAASALHVLFFVFSFLSQSFVSFASLSLRHYRSL